MSLASTQAIQSQSEWDQLAARARTARRAKSAAIYAFLIAVSLPLVVAYFWMATIAFSAKTGSPDTLVLWRALGFSAAGVAILWTWSIWAKTRQQAIVGSLVIGAVTLAVLAVAIGPDLHLRNFSFITERNFNDAVRKDAGFSSVGGVDFPSVWAAFGNSLIIAGFQTLIVSTTATMAGYYLSRFRFPGRAGMLRSLLVLHAFPVLTLIVPLFLVLNFFGLLDRLLGVILVLVTLELPFAVFIMKGFFDGVPWEIEMSALADGASRRQAFVRVVLPQVTNGIIAISVFSFIRGWEEYIFVFTFLIKNTNWVMSLYLFFVNDDLGGVDFGVVAAVGTFYLIPSLIIYIAAQKYLMQMTVGGVKG